MKRILSCILALLLLTLCACGNSDAQKGTTAPAAQTQPSANEAEAPAFKVGYYKVNITPEESVPLGGYAKPRERMSTGYNDYLYATICAITDAEGETAILIGIDLTSSYKTISHQIREEIVKAYDIPFENILYSASHMHSGPDLNQNDMPCISNYIRKLKLGITEGVGKALEDQKPATMYIGSAQTEGLNFVRRYVMNDGTYAGDNFGDYSSGIKEHETKADGQLQLIKFVREGDNDILLANFQTHPHRGGGADNTTITADLVGAFRTAMEEQKGVEVCYFSGAGGNINPSSRIKAENITKDYKEQGQALAAYAVEVYDSMTQVQTGAVKVKTETVDYPTDHSEDHLVNIAEDLYNRYSKNIITAAELKAEGKQYGIASSFHASAICTKANLGETLGFEHFTISIGDVAFVGAPEEMFDTNGMFIKENSPFEMTFILTYCNGTNGYIPSSIGFEHGGYEVHKCKFAPGTGEAIAEKFVEMLGDLHSQY